MITEETVSNTPLGPASAFAVGVVVRSSQGGLPGELGGQSVPRAPFLPVPSAQQHMGRDLACKP